VTEPESGQADRAMARLRARHRVQRAVGWLIAPLWVPLAPLVLRYGLGYRIVDAAQTRREFTRIRAESRAPLLICANHLTMIDSFLIAWALAPGWRYAIDFDAMPWNTPEVTNFASTTTSRALVYLAKCIPIRRGGSREEAAEVLDRIRLLLERGEIALLFPEGGRSRTGRVAVENAAWGVGRVVGAVEGCRVLCVYMRGDAQETWSDRPARGDRMRVSLACIEPKSDARGARRARDLAQQIIAQLARMEDAYFRERSGQPPAPAEEPAASPDEAGRSASVPAGSSDEAGRSATVPAASPDEAGRSARSAAAAADLAGGATHGGQ
jgi:hypothetical protein